MSIVLRIVLVLGALLALSIVVRKVRKSKIRIADSVYWVCAAVLLLVLAIILGGQWLIVAFGGKMFRTTPLDLETWLWIILGTSPVFIIGEVLRAVRRLRS